MTITEFLTARLDERSGPLDAWSRRLLEVGALNWLALPFADHPDYDEAWRP